MLGEILTLMAGTHSINFSGLMPGEPSGAQNPHIDGGSAEDLGTTRGPWVEFSMEVSCRRLECAHSWR